MRIHNSGQIINNLKDAPQAAFNRKPQGLWWAEEYTWVDLLGDGAAPGLNGRQAGAYNYQVDLKPGFRLLQLTDVEALLDFSREYGQPMPHAQEGFFWQRPGTRDRYDPGQDPKMPERARAFLIDWPAVARRWDGIEIPDLLDDTPRPRIDWLDTDWGVGSGCAWRTERLEINLVEPSVMPELHDYP
jgi:hypothetical protein